MNTEKQIKELEKSRQISRKVIPIQGSFLVTAIFFWIIGKFISIPIWITVIVIGMVAFGLFGYIINYIYCNWKLKTFEYKNE